MVVDEDEFRHGKEVYGATLHDIYYLDNRYKPIYVRVETYERFAKHKGIDTPDALIHRLLDIFEAMIKIEHSKGDWPSHEVNGLADRE